MLRHMIRKRLEKAQRDGRLQGPEGERLLELQNALQQGVGAPSLVYQSMVSPGHSRLDSSYHYLQLAFNEDVRQMRRVLPSIVRNERILIEAGTPYLKREGMAGIRAIRSIWPGHIVADLKASDGGAEEAQMALEAGATASTVLGNSPIETLDRFIAACRVSEMASMIDMLGVPDPLRVVMQLKLPPDVIVLHRGRDEENTRGKVIQYRHVTRLRSKFDMLISAAGGVDLREARSAVFNGASIVVVNVVSPGKPWQGIPANGDVGAMARSFLEEIE
jgi:bifunctional enzyme Fae/Hps